MIKLFMLKSAVGSCSLVLAVDFSYFFFIFFFFWVSLGLFSVIISQFTCEYILQLKNELLQGKIFFTL